MVDGEFEQFWWSVWTDEDKDGGALGCTGIVGMSEEVQWICWKRWQTHSRDWWKQKKSQKRWEEVGKGAMGGWYGGEKWGARTWRNGNGRQGMLNPAFPTHGQLQHIQEHREMQRNEEKSSIIVKEMRQRSGSTQVIFTIGTRVTCAKCALFPPASKLRNKLTRQPLAAVVCVMQRWIASVHTWNLWESKLQGWGSIIWKVRKVLFWPNTTTSFHAICKPENR